MKSGVVQGKPARPESTTIPRSESRSARRETWRGRHGPAAALGLVVLAGAAVGGYLGYGQYRVMRLADMVRRSFAARQYGEARGPLQRWLVKCPRSGEPQYYRAWLALVDDRPIEVVEAVGWAQRLGFDPAPLDVLRGIYQARAGRINDAEPNLRLAFDRNLEPRAEVAKELAGIYLATYRLTEAAEAVERYRALVPSAAQPYLWSNEIESRTGGTPDVLIRNYRAALEREPDLDKARLALAEVLSEDRRFDEAIREYRTYLRRNPRDARALAGLGRNAVQVGDIDAAIREFEAALEVDPGQVDALKELAQFDLRSGRFTRARRRLEYLTRIEPFDHEIRYSYAQALRSAGEPDEARLESERAAQLRQHYEAMIRLRSKLLSDPNDLESRSEVARWMLGHGHADEGVRWANEILRVDPRHAPTHRALSSYYAERRNQGLANYHRAMASSSQDAR